MANIEDYLDWRADIPFSVDPFNEVDNLVLSELIYADFDGVIDSSFKIKISIEDACEQFFKIHSEKELLENEAVTKMAPFLMKKMINSARFGGMKLAGYVNELDEDTQTQFAAITYYLPDGTIYVAFRGTDNTLVGWREDFNMCFMTGTGGQKRAVNYLNNNFSRTMKSIRVGGHSKGGNFAVYASAFCRNTVKDNIIEIYSNDGPGFLDEVLETDEYKSVANMIVSIVPESSIIGKLMYSDVDDEIVRSDSKGLFQHNGFSWQITRNKFLRCEQVDNTSIYWDKTIKEWVKGVDYDTRNMFLDIVFNSITDSTGATLMSEVTSAKVKSAMALKKGVDSLEKKDQDMFYEIVKKLITAGGLTFRDSLVDKKPSIGRRKTNKS